MTTDRDDALLDALGAGETVPGDDELAVLLSAWRADLDEPLPSAAPEPARHRIFTRPLVVAAATAVLAFGGLTAASATADPGSPLWPITRIVFGDRADSRVAEQNAQRLLAQARGAMVNGHPAEARQLVDQALAQIALITDSAARDHLLTEADAILALPARGTAPNPALPTAPVNPPATLPIPGGSTPSPSPTQGGLLPPILSSLLPSLPLH